MNKDVPTQLIGGEAETRKQRDGLFINISQEEREMVRTLREEHAVNISQLLRNAIRQAHLGLCQSPLAKHPEWGTGKKTRGKRA